MAQTLLRRAHTLADAAAQRDLLRAVPVCAPFEARLESAELWPFTANAVEVLQMNVGRRCNQVCTHCHVDAGPDRTESMNDQVVDACLNLVGTDRIGTLDITGGAPELHPRFRGIVNEATRRGAKVMHRCNLTAIQLPAYRDIPELLAENKVEIVASLPSLEAGQTDAQRGVGVFGGSLEGLKKLNELGYGRQDTGLQLNLAANPSGPRLPECQEELQAKWKSILFEQHGIEFSELFTITNMPISRFLYDLDESEQLEPYMGTLTAAFNPEAAKSTMCRTMVSVSHDGQLFDCDFNQMLDMPVAAAAPRNVLDEPAETMLQQLNGRKIRVGPHCFGCTAGAGSSCSGTVA